MREHEEKDRGLLSIKFWYPERRLHFIIINRLDENMGFVISQRHGRIRNENDGTGSSPDAST